MKFPSYATKENFSTAITFSIIVIHILAIFLAPFTYTHLGLIVFVSFYLLTMLGITAGNHRMLSHQSFKAVKPIKYLLSFLAVISLQGGPLRWVASHRLHHAKSDKEGDPHSPINNFLWSHIVWLFFKHPELSKEEQLKKLAPDLYKDKVLVFFQRRYILINIFFGLAVIALTYFLLGPKYALSVFVWGGMLRIVAVWHATWLVNSATHIWGYRNYDSKDTSQNNWLVALLCLGEGWHNNHHALPQVVSNQHRWFELDLSYWTIYALSRLGLVSDLKLRKITKK